MGMIVSIYGKDSSGKTVIAGNLGVLLAQFGKKVLVVDGNLESPALGLVFGISKPEVSVHEVLFKSAKVKKALQKVGEGVDAILGNPDAELRPAVDIEKFRRIISDLDYDITLLDCSGGINQDTMYLVSIGESILLIANPDLTSIATTLKMKTFLKKFYFRILGVILNCAGSGTDVPADVIEYLLGIPIISVIPYDEEIQKSLISGVPSVLRNPNSPAAVKLREIATLLVRKLFIAEDKVV